MPKPSNKLTEINTRRAIHLERVKSHEQGEFLSFFERMRMEVLRLLSKDITTFRRRRLETELKGLNDAIRNIHVDYKDVWLSQIRELSKADIKFQLEALNTVADFDFQLPPPKQVEAAIFSRPLSVHGIHGGELLTDFFDDVSERDIRRIDNAIRLGYAQGNTTRDITSSILGIAANNFKDGALESFKRSANLITRTSLQHASQVSRQTLYENNRSIIKGVEWSSTLDSRTTTTCFVGETNVLPVGDLENIYRSKYVGNIITITTASGKQISGTPNHPILTPDGFLPMHKFNPGEHVVYSVLGNGSGIFSNYNVCMETNIAKIFDSFNKPSVFRVFRKSASAIDFYGDGVGMNGEVDIVSPQSKLGGNIIGGRDKRIIDKFLSYISNNSSFLRFSGFLFSALSWLPPVVAPKFNSISFKNAPNPFMSTSAKRGRNLTGAHPFIIKLYSFVGVFHKMYVGLTTFKSWHSSDAFKKAGDCCSSDTVGSTDRGGGRSLPVELDDVVSVSSEFKSCHVYTLSTKTGLYMANGIIVKNCQSLDGQQFPLDKGPRPPVHIGCRSTTTPVFDERFKFLQEGATRSARGDDGVEKVNAKQTYYSWLKTQSADFQDSAIGPKWAKVLRDGGLSANRFSELRLDKKFKPLTLQQAKILEPLAFNKAGL